ncbi:MAG TPA: hypothetical protein VMT54_08340 [Candidatus Cybelea sp.]|nr:hypothetical protein [Candidatus Cybelea sp.]
MTVSTAINRERYATDGVTTAFTIHFPFFDDSDVNAVYVDASGIATALSLSSDFAVTGGAGAGGTLTTTATLGGGGTLTLYRDIPFTQEDDYVEDDPLPADTLEGGFDRAAMRDQQLKDAQDRALTFPVTIDPAVSAELPAPLGDALLGWASSGLALENKTLPAGTAVYSSIANTQIGSAAAEAVTPDALASLWQQGANIATAATLAKPADANLGGFYLLTGTTNVSNGWAGEKAGRRLAFRAVTGGFTLVHGSNWQNKTGANIVTAANDTFEMLVETGGAWRMLSYDRADGTALTSSAPAVVSFSANKGGTDQTGIASATSTKVTFGTEEWDIGGYYDTANSRFTPPAGKYLVTAAVLFTGGVVDQNNYYIYVSKNGSPLKSMGYVSSGTLGISCPLSVAVDASGSDYFEIICQGGGAGNKTVSGQSFYSFFQGLKVA